MAEQSIDVIGDALQEVFARKDGVKRLLELLVNASMHERAAGRRGHRNGTKPRTMATRVGGLELSVPQVRGCEPYHPSMFNKWQRSERALLVACAEMYFQGVSTRNVRDVLEAMCGGDVSAMTVSRVAAELDERLSAFRDRRLDHAAWPYLMGDARYESVRVDGRVVGQAVLVVVGVTADGGKEVLDWRVGDSESEQTWGDVFRGLKGRGLAGVRLVTSDAHGGLRAALRRHFQGAAWQRCRVHFKRELGRKVSYRALGELLSDVAAAFGPDDRAECLRRAEEVAAKWAPRCPAVAAMLRGGGFEDCLAVLALPANHRRQLASTNLLESLMRRLKKRTAVVCVFPNRASCERLVGAQLLEVHEDWQAARRPYLNMERREPPTVTTADAA